VGGTWNSTVNVTNEKALLPRKFSFSANKVVMQVQKMVNWELQK